MKTKLLKRLRRQARKLYYVEVKLNKQNWIVELTKVNPGYMPDRTRGLQTYSGYSSQRDKFEFVLNQLKHRCDQERRGYILKYIATRRYKQIKTKKVY